MSRDMPRALKVFQTQIGFYELIVAPPSQAAALRAWGCHLTREIELFAERLGAIAAEEQDLRSRRTAVEAEATAAERRHDALRSEADKVLRREEEAYAAAGKA